MKFFECERRQNGWIQDGRIQDGCHHQVSQNEWDLKSEFLCKMVWIQSWHISEWIIREDTKNVWIQDGKIWWQNSRWLNPRWWEFKMAASHWKFESESEWVKVFFFVQNGSVWIQDGRIQDGWHHQIKLSENWMSLSQSFVQNCWIQDGSIQDGCHHKVEWQWMSEEFFFCSKWLNPRWQISRWLTSSS